MCGNKSCESLTEVLCTIVKLQKQGKCIDGSIQSCDRPFLGVNINNIFNTRPITLYTCPTNTLWTMPWVDGEKTGTSSVFRVEAVEDCCATFRVLREIDGTLESTDSFFTINLNCVGAIQCLDDVFIACS